MEGICTRTRVTCSSLSCIWTSSRPRRPEDQWDLLTLKRNRWDIILPIGSMYGIYTNIGGILMGSMLPYIAYMDPMGYKIMLKHIQSCGNQSYFILKSHCHLPNPRFLEPLHSDIFFSTTPQTPKTPRIFAQTRRVRALFSSSNLSTTKAVGYPPPPPPVMLVALVTCVYRNIYI